LTYSSDDFTDPDIYLKKIRGMLRLTVEDCDDDRQTGTSEVEVNGNFGADGNGRLWGKFKSTRTDGEGGWIGSYVASGSSDGTLHLRGVSRGWGVQRGLHSWFTIEYPPILSQFDPIVGDIDGWILENRGRKRGWR
jgi:hypothetical protein